MKIIKKIYIVHNFFHKDTILDNTTLLCYSKNLSNILLCTIVTIGIAFKKNIYTFFLSSRYSR